MQSMEIELLYQAVLSLKTPEECQLFFEDICTIKEVHALSQRLQVAALLVEGKTFLEISEKTGASSATISRVNKCLMYGQGGYRTVLQRLDRMEE